MANTSCSERARAVLDRCLAGEPVADQAIHDLLECPQEFFGIVVEGLADRFEPRLCDVYVDLFVRAFTRDGVERSALRRRYDTIRRVAAFDREPADVVVLSRVTLGADVVITSQFLDAAKKRFPRARIHLAGSRKAWELFSGDPRVRHLEIAYPRAGSFQERLAPWRQLRDSIPEGSLVLDPDSRITQLGVLPVADSYCFFESRAYGGESDATLAELARRWLAEVLGVDAQPYVALPAAIQRAGVSISLGVGENMAKRIAGDFERDLLRYVAGKGGSVFVDKGAGGEEAERVMRAVEDTGVQVFDGAFAAFASIIAASDLYIGYDSAGQHVAATCGVPLVTVFAGYPCDRMFERWKPSGRGPIEIVRVTPGETPAGVLQRTRQSIHRLAIL